MNDIKGLESNIKNCIDAAEQYKSELMLILQRKYEKDHKGSGTPFQVLRQAIKEVRKIPEVSELEKIGKDSNKRRAIILGDLLIQQGYMLDRADYFPMLDEDGNEQCFEDGTPIKIRVLNDDSLFPSISHAKELLIETYKRYREENERRSSLVSPLSQTARESLKKAQRMRYMPSNEMLRIYIEGMLDNEFEDWIADVKSIYEMKANNPLKPNIKKLEKLYAIKTPAADMIFNGKFSEENKVQTRDVTWKPEKGSKRYKPRKGEVIKTFESIEHISGAVSNIDQKMLWNAFNTLTALGETFITPEQLYFNSGLGLKGSQWKLTEAQNQYIIDSIESMFPQRYVYHKEDRLYGSNELVPATSKNHPNMSRYEEKVLESKRAFDLMPDAEYGEIKIDGEIITQGWELKKTGLDYTCPIFRIGYVNGNYIQIDPETLCEMRPKRDSEIGKMVFDYFFFNTGYGNAKRTLETFAEKYGLDLKNKEVKRIIKDQMRKIGKKMKEKGFLTVFDDSHLNEGYIRIRSKEHKAVKHEARKIAEKAEREEIREELTREDPLSLPTPAAEPDAEPPKRYKYVDGKKVLIK